MFYFIVFIIIVIIIIVKVIGGKTNNRGYIDNSGEIKEVEDIYVKYPDTVSGVILTAYDGTYAVFKKGNNVYTLKVEGIPMTDEASRIHEQNKFKIWVRKKQNSSYKGKIEGLLVDFKELD